MAEKSASRGEIFVVDDDPAVRETLSLVLTAGGYQVICFADGAAPTVVRDAADDSALYVLMPMRV